MKKLLFFLVILFLVSSSFANTSVEQPYIKASEIFIPVGGTGQKISLMELSQISIRDMQTLTDRKLGMMEKIAFKAAQKKLRKNINPDGTFNKNLAKKLEKRIEVEGEFHAGGFLLGFFLPLIGVLIAYLINDDRKRRRIKWAWIGSGVWIVLVILFIAANAGS